MAPLTKGYSSESIGKNIKTEETSGDKPHKQAVAIALNTARKAADEAGKPDKGPKPMEKGHDSEDSGRDPMRGQDVPTRMMHSLGMKGPIGVHIEMMRALEEGADKLTYRGRERMPKSEFAFPKEKTEDNPAGKGGYPLNDPEHARAALRYGARDLSPQKDAELKRKVENKFPSIDVGGKEKGK